MTRDEAERAHVRDRLRAAADQIEIGTLLRGFGLRVAVGGLAAGLILGASPAARRAVLNGLRAGYRQMQAIRAQQRAMR